MKFAIDYSQPLQDRKIEYLPHEHSVDMTPIINSVVCTLNINKLNLSVSNEKSGGYPSTELQAKINFAVGHENLWDETEELDSPPQDKIMQIWGYFPNNWKRASINAPKAKQGALILKDRLESGFSYGVFQEEVPVYCDPDSRWVCLIDPNAKGQTVEFIKDCIAVLNDDQELAALWMRLDVVPPFSKEQSKKFKVVIQKENQNPFNLKKFKC
jgi:hypothetical protein